MVETEGTKLPTPHPVIEPVSGTRARNGIFDAETGAQKPPFRLVETIQRRPEIRKAPVPAGLARKS